MPSRDYEVVVICRITRSIPRFRSEGETRESRFTNGRGNNPVSPDARKIPWLALFPDEPQGLSAKGGDADQYIVAAHRRREIDPFYKKFLREETPWSSFLKDYSDLRDPRASAEYETGVRVSTLTAASFCSGWRVEFVLLVSVFLKSGAKETEATGLKEVRERGPFSPK